MITTITRRLIRNSCSLGVAGTVLLLLTGCSQSLVRPVTDTTPPGISLIGSREGQGIWRRVQPFVQKLLPLARVRDALLVGLCWGLLPCGLIYTALAWSATAAHWLQSATLMFCFGLGTLPVMFATGIAGEKLAALLRKKALRNIAAVLLISFGGWTATAAVMQALPGSGGSAHQHH